jgi:hypothetical protein
VRNFKTKDKEMKKSSIIFQSLFTIICVILVLFFAGCVKTGSSKKKGMKTEVEIAENSTKLVLQWAKVFKNKKSSFSAKEMKEFEANLAQKTNYGYVVGKATRYLVYIKESMDYGKNDVFGYPMKEWDLSSLHSACKQLVHDVKGLSAKSSFTVSPVAVRELYELFHFTFTDFEDTEIRNVIKMHFSHKRTGDKCYAYCTCKDTGILERHPFYLRVMVPGNSPEEPAFVTVCEKESLVKICTDKQLQGIAAEYAWAREKFPGCERTAQRYGERIIDGKPVQVDVLEFKLPDGTTKKITFDTSDFKVDFLFD